MRYSWYFVENVISMNIWTYKEFIKIKYVNEVPNLMKMKMLFH